MKYALTLIVLALVALSCQNERTPKQNRDLGRKIIPTEAMDFQEEIEMEPPRSSEPAPPYTLDKGSKIIRSGNLQYEVDDLYTSKARVDQIIRSLGAYYEDESYREYGGTNKYDLQIRLPGSKFDSLITLLEQGVGELKVKSLTANDVTEEYVDLKIRLDNKLAVLAQYKSILKKATSIEEILIVNEKIRRLEEEIESKKGRIRFLDDRVLYAQLHLELTQKVEVVLASTPSYGSRLSKAFMSGIHGFMNFVVGIVYVWPFLLWIVLMWAIWSRIRKLRKTKLKSSEAEL